MIKLDAATQYFDSKNLDKAVFICVEADGSLKFIDEFQVKSDIPAEDLAGIDELYVTLQAEYDNAQYSRDRAVAYPSIEDQLDKIYHDGIDAWKADIKAVKDEYPKP